MFEIIWTDETFSLVIITVWMIVPTVLGYTFGDYSGALTGCMFALLCLPAILFVLAITILKGHEDIYG